jgi:hypothetical protein
MSFSNRLKNGKGEDGDNDVIAGNFFPSVLYQELCFAVKCCLKKYMAFQLGRPI